MAPWCLLWTYSVVSLMAPWCLLWTYSVVSLMAPWRLLWTYSVVSLMAPYIPPSLFFFPLFFPTFFLFFLAFIFFSFLLSFFFLSFLSSVNRKVRTNIPTSCRLLLVTTNQLLVTTNQLQTAASHYPIKRRSSLAVLCLSTFRPFVLLHFSESSSKLSKYHYCC